jgi:hypothetical protein
MQTCGPCAKPRCERALSRRDALGGHRLSRRHPRHGGDDRVVPGQDAASGGVVEPERLRDDGDSQGPPRSRARLGSSRRLDRGDQPVVF